MQFPKMLVGLLASLFLFVCISCSSKSDPASAVSSGTDGVQEQLVAVSGLEPLSLSAFSNVGADRLATGSVETEDGNGNGDMDNMDDNDQNDNDVPDGVEFQLTQAAASVSYNAQFCPFSAGSANCVSLGSVATDNMGNADTSLQFPQKGTFAGVFLLTRNNQAQFVSGFTVPGTGSQGDGDHGFEADLQRVAVVSGGLGPAFGSAGSDAIVSGKVEVNNQGNDQSSAQSNDDNGGNQGPVEVKLKGAAAGVSYAVEFCRFGLGPSDCLSVGKLSTDMSGNADAEFAFPMTGTFDGVFVLTRSINGQNQNEFVTGFQR
jgi:hypothetical protein